MQRASPSYSRVLMRYYFEHQSYQQIAREEGISLKTVESRLYRARKILRKRWEGGNVKCSISAPREWERFLAGENPEQELMMENHLKACDQCRQVFLESIHAAELKRAQAVIKPDFTAQTLSLIRKSVAKKRPSSRRTNTRSLLLYYTAAAVLTLVLTGGESYKT